MDDKNIKEPSQDPAPKPSIDDVLKKMGQTDSVVDKKNEDNEQLEKLKDVLSQVDSSSSTPPAPQSQQKKVSEEKPFQVTLSPNVEKLKEKIKIYQK